MTVGLLLFLIALVAGAYMAWTIGANDVANAIGPLSAIHAALGGGVAGGEPATARGQLHG